VDDVYDSTVSGSGGFELQTIFTGRSGYHKYTLVVTTSINNGIFQLMFVGGDLDKGVTLPTRQTLVIYGDSIAGFVGVSSFSHIAATLLGWGCHSYGHPGDPISDTTPSNPPVAGASDVGAFFIEYGANDYGLQKALATYQSKISEWITAGVTAWPTAEIIVNRIWDRITVTETVGTLADYRARVDAAVAAAANPLVVAAASESWIVHADDTSDGLHPTTTDNDTPPTGNYKIGVALAAMLAPSTLARRRAGSSRTGTRTPIYG
jgi:hypothetical protein